MLYSKVKGLIIRKVHNAWQSYTSAKIMYDLHIQFIPGWLKKCGLHPACFWGLLVLLCQQDSVHPACSLPIAMGICLELQTQHEGTSVRQGGMIYSQC